MLSRALFIGAIAYVNDKIYSNWNECSFFNIEYNIIMTCISLVLIGLLIIFIWPIIYGGAIIHGILFSIREIKRIKKAVNKLKKEGEETNG